MWTLLIVCLAMATFFGSTEAVGSHRHDSPRARKRYVSSYTGGGGYGGYTGGYAGGYGGGASSGSFASAGGGAGAFAGDFPFGAYAGSRYGHNYGAGFIDPYEFHQRLTAHVLAQNAATTNALASTYSSGDASVYADASYQPDYLPEEHDRINQQIYYDQLRRRHHHHRGGGSSHRYAPNFAAASGSIGPGGHHQTAYINPENRDVPNVVNRFGESSSPGGFKGVSVSSFSGSSNVDGKHTSHRAATTTINDNGKVTSYTVHS